MIIATGVLITVIFGFLSLTVDLGRILLARSQLQDAVDAAARYAVTGISDNTYLSKAQSVASTNIVDLTALALTSADVELGTWNSTTKVFTVTASSPNAIRVTGRRIETRGTAIPMVLGRVIGLLSMDLEATSIAVAASSPLPDIIGTSTVSLSGGTQIRRLSGESGTVKVASNGSIGVPWGCYIYGDAYYRSTAPSEPGNGITGTNVAMTADASLPTVSVPSGTANLGAVNVGYSGMTVAPGNYSCTSLTIGGGGAFNVTGDVNIYVSGPVTIGNGCTINTNNGARKVTLYLTGSNTADFNMSSTFHVRIYGPNATVNLTGSSPLVGSVMCKTLNLVGSANIAYSSVLSLSGVAEGSGGGSGGAISVVK